MYCSIVFTVYTIARYLYIYTRIFMYNNTVRVHRFHLQRIRETKHFDRLLKVINYHRFE